MIDDLEAAIAADIAAADPYRIALRDAAAAIRGHPVEMRLTVLPEGNEGQVVVRDLREELAKMVEGLGT